MPIHLELLAMGDIGLQGLPFLKVKGSPKDLCNAVRTKVALDAAKKV